MISTLFVLLQKVQDERFIEADMICAGKDKEVRGQDACKGDSGYR